MNISNYIKEVGDLKFSQMVGCKQRTAAAWRRKERTPNKHNIPIVVKATNGVVSAAGCLDLE